MAHKEAYLHVILRRHISPGNMRNDTSTGTYGEPFIDWDLCQINDGDRQIRLARTVCVIVIECV
jgi:hypothetical protein